MSASEVRTKIAEVQKAMSDPSSWSWSQRTGKREVSPLFLQDVSELIEAFGDFTGKAKAEHLDYFKEIRQIEEEARRYFESMPQSSLVDYCFELVNLSIGKISEAVSFVAGLDAIPAEKKVSRLAYEKVAEENEANKRLIEIMVRYKGLPELNELMENARNAKLPVDEHWVLALCSANLIEAIVSKKLEELKLPTDGSFESKYKRLSNAIKEKEQREIQQLLPPALYKGIRNKLDHASHSNRVTPKEAKDISRFVMNLIEEVFQ
jgi:hypothetical protein